MSRIVGSDYMSRYERRSYKGAADLVRLVAFAQRMTAARLPGPPYYHLGDVVWQLYAYDTSDDVVIWSDGERVAGFAIFEPPLNVQFELDPADDGDDALMDEIIAWAEERRSLVADTGSTPVAYAMLGTGTLSISVFASDVRRAEYLVAHGYARVEAWVGTIRA